jgi:hypothetical protein
MLSDPGMGTFEIYAGPGRFSVDGEADEQVDERRFETIRVK